MAFRLHSSELLLQYFAFFFLITYFWCIYHGFRVVFCHNP